MSGAWCEALTELAPHGLVRCLDEVWSATANVPIASSERIRVVAVDGLRLQVVRHIPKRG